MSARTQLRYVKNSHWILLALTALRLEAAETYRLDSSNTHVSFAVQHLGIQWVTARFSDISGQFVVDHSGAASRVDVTVGMASLECAEPRWNERLRSADWLDVQRYPQMTYHSSRIEMAGQRAVASGELTLHGVTRPIVLNVSLLKCSSGHCQFAAYGHINRSEYGLPHGFWAGGDKVDIAISGAPAPIAHSRAPG
jgi:polyisoprenoid-binding protein YceI